MAGSSRESFSHSPAALDYGRYQHFAEFLNAEALIDSVPPLASYAVDLFAPRTRR